MLFLQRKKGEGIYLFAGEDVIYVKLATNSYGQLGLAIEADQSVKIYREELVKQQLKEDANGNA